MAYYVHNGELYETTELYHHGILGQRWGVRRFQNKDGSLKPAGEKRYGGPQRKASGQKEKDSTKSKYDHSKSDRAENIARFALDVGLDVVTLNPFGLAKDIHRGAEVAVSSVKESSYKSRANKLETDDKTGMPLKNKEWTEKQDVKAVNPAFKNFDENTKNNCVLCSMTMELRQRGYDVAANKASIGYTHDDIKRWFPDVKYKDYSFTADEMKQMRPNADLTKANEVQFTKAIADKQSRMMVADRMLSDMAKEPDGSRGFVGVKWAGLNGGGHSMYYKKENGKVRIFDGQSGKIYDDPHKIFKHGYEFSYARVDNKKFDPKTIREVTL